MMTIFSLNPPLIKEQVPSRLVFGNRYTLKSIIFWDITPCSPLKVNRRFRGMYRLHLQGQGISQARNQHKSRWQAAYSSTLKMEAIYSSEMSVDFQQNTRRYIPEHNTLHNHHCENLKSYTGIHWFNSKKINLQIDWFNNQLTINWQLTKNCTQPTALTSTL
jgi:hypothetical protein